jgi:hypothetical protein
VKGRVLLVGLAAVSLTVSACTGSSGDRPTNTPRPPVSISWSKVGSLPNVRATSFAADEFSGTVYVGGSLPASAASAYSGPLIKGGVRKPVLWTGRSTTWAQAQLEVTSFYGAQATLASLGAFGDRVVALGAAAGGAHANPRPSFFTGGPRELVEHEQNFYVYGGENAVGITSVAAAVQTFLMVGQWAPDGHRASGAIWTSPDGTAFTRHDVIPGLADSAGGQRTTSPQGVDVEAGRFVIVGSQTDLTKPSLSVAPAVWTSIDGTSVTTGHLQSNDGVLGGPSTVGCGSEHPAQLPSPLPDDYVLPGSCVAAGMVSAAGRQELAGWRISLGDSGTDAAEGRQLALVGCPAPRAAPDPGNPTPRMPTVRATMGPDGVGWIVASTSAAGVVCRIDRAGTARATTLPQGCVPQSVQPMSGSAVEPRVEVFCAVPGGVDVYSAG